MAEPSSPTDTERMADLAEWFSYVFTWLAGEVSDSRIGTADSDDAPDQRVEQVRFITSELEAVLTGFRRATEMMIAMTAPLPPIPAIAYKRPTRAPHLRLMK